MRRTASLFEAGASNHTGSNFLCGPKLQLRALLIRTLRLLLGVSGAMQFTGEQLAKIGALCQQYGVRELALFGSRARGDNRPESDYDFLVDYLPSTRPGLIEFIGLEQDLSDLLSSKVDLVTRRGLRSQLQQSVLHDSLTVYAQRYPAIRSAMGDPVSDER